ncbi:MAG: tetratricopeptide repeat protein [Bryobacteraceae bacterium]|jgi:hypothetical protein
MAALLLPLRKVSAQTSSLGRMLICESTSNVCDQPDARLEIVWRFDGTEGTVSSPASQAGVHLTIERLDGSSIVVRAVAQSGPAAGLVAVYTGSIRGNRIAGTVQWSWPGRNYPSGGFFSGVLGDRLAAVAEPDARAGSLNAPPSELLVCENGGSCNAAWTFNGPTGTGTWFTRNPTRASLTLLRFDGDYIVVRRTEPAGGISATYAGSLRGNRYEGTIVWSSPGHPGESTGYWTATVPHTTCSEQDGIEGTDAMLVGRYALMFKRDRDALNCYIVAAKLGDATAQAAVGLLYYQGRGSVAQDYQQAFFWLHKAADQGVYAAQRTVAEMYTAGQGTERDPTQAAIYAARADEQKHDMERRQDLEEREQARHQEQTQRAADRFAQLMSSFVLGASFGLLF